MMSIDVARRERVVRRMLNRLDAEALALRLPIWTDTTLQERRHAYVRAVDRLNAMWARTLDVAAREGCARGRWRVRGGGR